MRILDGIRIVDGTVGLAGPFASRILAEAGADVIRLEHTADPVRESNPAAWATWNRSKRSMTVASLDAGQLRDLLARADVFIHDLSPAEAARRGLDHAALKAAHPHLIVATVTGYPPGHPLEDLPAEEILVQASLGAMDEQQGHVDGPVFIRLPFASWGAAFLLAGGIGARLYQREKDGVVAPISTSLVQGALVAHSLIWQRAENPPAWMVAHTLPKVDSPGQLALFECADGRWIQVLGGFSEVPPMVEFLAEIDRVDLVNAIPVTKQNYADWADVFRRRPSEEWLAALRAADVPVTPVLKVGEILGEEQSSVNGYAIEVDDPVIGRALQAGYPFHVAPPLEVRAPAPGCGEHTDEIARELEGEAPRPAPAATSATALPLVGIRVLDLGMYVSSPFAAQCLADLGADVIKLEPPTGDKGRSINQFTSCQRGKRSLAIDLRREEAREVLVRLIREMDVVSHNIREDAAARLGIDEASLKQVNPSVILSHVTAYGKEGPWAHLPGYDPNAQALSGWEVGIAGEGNPPSYVRNSLMDPFTGLASFVGTVLALYHRERTGEANRVDASLLGVAATLSSESVMRLPERAPTPVAQVDSTQRILSPGYGVYATRDAWVAIAAKDDATRTRLCGALSTTLEDLAAAISGRTTDDVLLALGEACVPAVAVAMNNRDQFFDTESQRETQLAVRTQSADWGWLDTPGAYWTLPGQRLNLQRSVPALGQHTGEILAELGFERDAIESLSAAGVIAGSLE